MLQRTEHSIAVPGKAPTAPLVMLPGTLCDARVYAPVLELLGRQAEIPPLSGAASSIELATNLLRNLPRQFALCGFSLGVIVALEMAAQAPERVERLALIGGNPGVLDPTAAEARRGQTLAEFLGASFAHSPSGVHGTIADMADATATAFAEQTAITLGRADSRQRLHRLSMPTLVLCGADDWICPPAMSIDMANRLPNARLAIIEGAGHYVTLEQPAAVAREIAAWLATPTNTLH